MEIQGTAFGTITIDGKTHEHDVIIPTIQAAESSSGALHFAADQVQRIVTEAAKLYFDSRRTRADAFIDRHFSLAGSLALHRKALGWDVLRAPLNILLAVPHIAIKLAAAAARALHARRISGYLASRQILLDTAVGREIEWLILTELLELPFRQEDRMSCRDALAETILASPHMQEALNETLEAIGRRVDDPAFRNQLEQATATYAGTRCAAAEITTALVTLGAGAAAVKQITPGAMALGPALAGVMAHQAAVVSFPLGATLGGLWYGAFPVAASSGLIAGVTASLMAASAAVAAFAGIVADPVQRRFGLHRRRILRLVDALERRFDGHSEVGFVVRDHYVARLLTLLQLLAGAYRLAVR
jgi:hypothetical protein